MTPLLYLIGQPGSGKTTLVREALRGVTCYEAVGGVPRIVYWARGQCSGAQLGVARERFGGTDALAMNAQPAVVAWLLADVVNGSVGMPAIIAEGDRLANSKFFEAVSHAFALRVVLLDTPDDVAAARRAARGSSQSDTWIKGRQTKVANLAAKWVAPEDRLDGRRSVEELAAQLRQYAAVQTIRGG